MPTHTGHFELHATGREYRWVEHSFSTTIDATDPPVTVKIRCDYLGEVTKCLPCGRTEGSWFIVNRVFVHGNQAVIDVGYQKHDTTKILYVEYTSDPAVAARKAAEQEAKRQEKIREAKMEQARQVRSTFGLFQRKNVDDSSADKKIYCCRSKKLR